MKKYNKQKIYKNFNRKNKWFGIIDYKSLVVLVVYIFIIFTILRYTNIKIEYALYVFMFLTVPVVAVVFININNEVAIDIIYIILKFYFKQGMYVNKKYKKSYKKVVYKKIQNKKI